VNYKFMEVKGKMELVGLGGSVELSAWRVKICNLQIIGVGGNWPKEWEKGRNSKNAQTKHNSPKGRKGHCEKKEIPPKEE